MRELTVDFNSENPLSGGCDAGYIGENNATKLILKPSAELLASPCSFFVAVFLTKGEVFRSEHFEPAEELEIMLGSHLTRDHYLKVQLEGYSEENMLVCKSPMVSEIRFMPSVSGCESEIDPENYLLKTQIVLNSENRHAHENSGVLDSLSETNGVLSFNGKNVCGHETEKTVVLSVENGDVDALKTVNGVTALNIITYSDFDSFVIPADAEIKSVELNLSHEDLPEWIDMRDMFIYDSENPYIFCCRKLFTDSETNFVTLCKTFFINNPNSISNLISNMLLKNVRVTYVEKFGQEGLNE